MERSSQVIQHGNIKKLIFFLQKSSKLNFDLYFDLCQRAENIFSVISFTTSSTLVWQHGIVHLLQQALNFMSLVMFIFSVNLIVSIALS